MLIVNWFFTFVTYLPSPHVPSLPLIYLMFFVAVNAEIFFPPFHAICHRRILECIKIVLETTCLIGGGGGEGLRQRRKSQNSL